MPTPSIKQKPTIPDVKRFRYVIGIDPGVTTGIAIWDREIASFQLVESGSILSVLQVVKDWKDYKDIFVRVEDARKRKWFGKTQREVLQGAGSIKRDCQIWEEFLELHNIPHEFVAPKNNITKVDAKMFARYTGYKAQTNEHSRDAAMLIYQL